jgi:serine/threonine protein kinase
MLKELRKLCADEADKRLRFRLEAEITGGLEHPGIVPVYGLGHYPDGRLFYAMRFIRGQTLRTEIRRFHAESTTGSRKNLVLRKLIQRFAQVCQAVSYAHSRGVLHRDLKSDNVMLGDFGETLVVDWGMARVMGSLTDAETDETATVRKPLCPLSGSDVSPTIEGTVVGTPQYMSPEQAAGEVENLGPGTDVYSLGAILYEIITSVPPHDLIRPDDGEVDLAATLENVRAGQIRDPRETPANTEAPLAAICLHALATRPGDRYQSPGHLAADLERWLADESVTAFREPVMQRVRRWTRHHPRLVTALSSTLLLGALSGLLIAAVAGSKNRELTKANAALAQAISQAETARQSAQEHAEAAAAGQLDAEQSTRMALETMNLVIVDLPARLGSLPGSDSIKAEILSKVVPNLERLSERHLGRREIGRELVRGLSATAAAVQNLSIAPEAARTLTESDVDTTGPEVAVRLRRQVVALVQRISSRFPNDVTTRYELFAAWRDLGVSLSYAGHFVEAAAANREAIDLIEQQIKDDPDNRTLLSNRIFVTQQLGDAVRLADGIEAAGRHYHRLRDLVVKFTDDAPDPLEPELQMFLTLVHERIALLSDHDGDYVAAVQSFRESLASTQRAELRNPNDLYIRRHMALKNFNIGRTLLRVEDVASARPYFRRGMRQAVELAADAPGNIRPVEIVEIIMPTFQATRRADDVDEDIWLDLLTASTNINDVGKSAANFWRVNYSVGKSSLQEGNLDVAFHFYLQAARVAERLRESLLRDDDDSVSTALVRTELRAALDSFEEMLTDVQNALDDSPLDHTVASELFKTLTKIGRLQLSAGRTSAALKTFQYVEQLAHQAVDDFAAEWSIFAAQYQVSALAFVAEARAELGDHSAALKSLLAALQIARTHQLGQSDSRAVRTTLATSLANCSRSLAVHGRYDESRQLIDEFETTVAGDQDVGRRLKESGVNDSSSLRSLTARFELATGPIDSVLAQPVDQVPMLLQLRVKSLAAIGNLQEAAVAAEQLAQTPNSTRRQLVMSARIICRAVTAMTEAVHAGESSDQSARADELLEVAVSALNAAIAAGWNDFEYLRNDVALRPLRESAEFQELLSAQ